MSLEELNLSKLTEIDELQQIESEAKDLLWANDELPGGAPENVAYSLRRLDAGLGELLELSERGTATGDRLADCAERIATAAEAIAATLEKLQKQAEAFSA